MKRIFSITLIIALAILLAACNFPTPSDTNVHLYSYNWRMESVISNNNGIAVGEQSSSYPSAKVVELYLQANNASYVGEDGALITNSAITVSDMTNNQVYFSMYTKIEETETRSTYQVYMDENGGTATVLLTEYPDGTVVPALQIILQDYILNFVSTEEEIPTPFPNPS